MNINYKKCIAFFFLIGKHSFFLIEKLKFVILLKENFWKSEC